MCLVKGVQGGRPLNRVEKFNAGGDTIEGTMDLNLRLYSEMYLFSNYHLFFQSNSLFQVKIENWAGCFSFNEWCLKMIRQTLKLLRQIFSKLTIQTPERHLWRRSGVSVVNFKHICCKKCVWSLWDIIH